MTVCERNVKEIQNLTIRGGMMSMRFDRISPTEFRVSHASMDPTQPVCPKCASYIAPGEEDDHRYEKYQQVNEDYMIDQVEALFDDCEEENPNVIAINEGLKDEIYIVKDFSSAE